MRSQRPSRLMTSIDRRSRPGTVTSSPHRTQRTGRILILSPNSPLMLGGMAHFVRELGDGVEALGYDVEYLHRENSLPAWMNQKSFARMRKFSASALGYFIGRRAQAKLDDKVVAVISNRVVGYYPLHPSSKRTPLIHFYHGTYRGQAEAIRPFITSLGYLSLK